jgi:pimeloyl-ACP methyl ester carboxylesterase
MSEFALPETRYALSGEVNIAYQAMGDGPVDIIMVPGFVSHVEFQHEAPRYTAFLRRLSAFARVITFDKRGQGLSDRISGAPSLEERMDDVRAVMDAVGSERAAVWGFSEGCTMSALFAATYPGRVSKLILFGGFAEAVPNLPTAVAENVANCTARSATQCGSNLVSSRCLLKTGIFQIFAGDYRRFRSGSGQIRSPETNRQFAKARYWRACLALPRIESPGAALPGWRRSADRTGL